jgi:hypothetical protein
VSRADFVATLWWDSLVDTGSEILVRTKEVETMTTNGAEPAASRPPRYRRRESVDEQVRRRDIRPVQSIEDMVCYDIFETDEELDAFLAHVYAERHANLA